MLLARDPLQKALKPWGTDPLSSSSLEPEAAPKWTQWGWGQISGRCSCCQGLEEWNTHCEDGGFLGASELHQAILKLPPIALCAQGVPGSPCSGGDCFKPLTEVQRPVGSSARPLGWAVGGLQ